MYIQMWDSTSIRVTGEMFEDFYTLNDVALYLKVSIRTVSRYKITFLDAFYYLKMRGLI
jgi:hypothetical protein